MKPRILIVDDEELIRWSLTEDLASAGFAAVAVEKASQALERLDMDPPDLILADLRLGDSSGLDILKTAHRAHPDIPVILMTGFADVTSAVLALREGAADYIIKPLQLDALQVTLRRALETSALRRRVAETHRRQRLRYNFDAMVAESPAMARALGDARKMAAAPDATILILGESGCGKDLLARAIHYESPRAAQPFMEITCTAIPEDLLESELFGHEKGAFTGASGRKLGLLELAAGGTVFLNEVGHMPRPLQPKLLRVLEDKTFRRVGGTEDITIDARIIAATNEDLETAVAEQRFRADLYYRLDVLTIVLPPLRERPEDTRPLIERLLDQLSLELRKPRPEISTQMLQLLRDYKWPGNVRELRNVLERMMILGELSLPRGRPLVAQDTCVDPPGPSGPILPLEGTRLEDMERAMIRQTMERTGQNQQKAAAILGLSRDALRRRLEKFELLPPPRTE